MHHYDGCYQQYMTAPLERWCRFRKFKDMKQHRLLCAGITTSTRCGTAANRPAISSRLLDRRTGPPGIRSQQVWFRVAAIGQRIKNEALAKKLGAHVYIDSKLRTQPKRCPKARRRSSDLATRPSSKAMSELIDGLGTNGKLMVVGADFAPIEVTPLQLIGGTRTIQGWTTGTAIDAEDTLRFAELTGVRPMIETYPLEKAAEAYARMISGDAQFRVVLTM